MVKALENIELSSKNKYEIDKELILYKFSNLDSSNRKISYDTSKKFIQFHFLIKGVSKFIYHEGRYTLPLKNEFSLLLYNPLIDLPVEIELNSGSKLISILISIDKLHRLFSNDYQTLPFLSEKNINNKFYQENPLNPSILAVLNQLYNSNIGDNVKSLYMKGKIFELLSIYFNKSDNPNLNLCPFLSDDNNLKKIKKAKEILIERMSEPPTLEKLSNEVEISLKNLKEGFKKVYGNTVFGYLYEHKMNVASQLLTSKNYNVNEVALHLGYSTSSHFINAFKNKFGTTPKRYLNSN
tara:strand:+ start:926 stop:1813 length:888 start_codon:yes stop_codon:yes gene_type:complete